MKRNLRPSVFAILAILSAAQSVARPASAQGPLQEQPPQQQPSQQPSTDSAADSAAASSAPAAATSSQIAVENWVKPTSGWLYVLDPKPSANDSGGRIWLLDPSTAKVMGSIRTGDSPDFALSPDGSRLYVASFSEDVAEDSELAVIDTAAGTIVQTATIENRVAAKSLPPFSTMAVSGDGVALRVLVESTNSKGAPWFHLVTFDTRSGALRPTTVHLGNCGPGRFISQRIAGQVEFLCPRSNRVRLISLDADANELRNDDVVLPWERRVGAAEAIETRGATGAAGASAENIAIVRGDGAVYKMDLATQEFADTSAHPELPDRVLPSAWPTSPDGTRVYLGYNIDYNRRYDNRFYMEYGRPPNVRPDGATADEFHVLDANTWHKIGTIHTKLSFWSAVLSNDGGTLYALAPRNHTILVIDTARMRQIGEFKVGGAPALALVAP